MPSNIIGDPSVGPEDSKYYWNIYWSRFMKGNNLKYNIIPIGTIVNIPILFLDRDVKGKVTKIMLPGYKFLNTPVSELRYQIHTFNGKDVVLSFNNIHPVNNSNFIHIVRNGEDRSSNNADNKITERKQFGRNMSNNRSRK